MKVKDVIALLEENGWEHVRTNGDHRVFVKKGARRPVTVTGKPSDDVAKRTFSSIKREAGLK